MKKFFNEFKEFAMRGNVVDMAVGVIIGAAFKAIVDSLVNDLISPLLGTFLKTDFSDLAITLVEGVPNAADPAVWDVEPVLFRYGAFITAIINFIIMAFVIFLLVKGLNKLATLGKKKEEETPAEPTTKECPYCCSEIAIKATKCPHCASTLED